MFNKEYVDIGVFKESRVSIEGQIISPCDIEQNITI